MTGKGIAILAVMVYILAVAHDYILMTTTANYSPRAFRESLLANVAGGLLAVAAFVGMIRMSRRLATPRPKKKPTVGFRQDT